MVVYAQYHAVYDELVARWPVVAATVLTLVLVAVLPGFLRPDPLAKLPKVGVGHKEFMHKGGWSSYVEGYNQFKDGAWRITTARRSPGVLISPKFLPELKKLPEDVLSMTASIAESMHARYTQMEVDVPSIPHTIKASLTPALARLNPTIAAEVDDAMRMELPQTSEWTEVCINKKLLRVIAMASGRVFVGPELCRDEAYLDASINYTLDFMTAVHMINFTPVWLRPFVSRFLPQIRKLHRRIQEAHDFLTPVVKARNKAAQSLDYQKPEDMLQWLIDSQGKFHIEDDKQLVKNQMALSFAAIHTTTMTTTNAIYTLAADPSLVPMLREDVQQALEKSEGEFTGLALQDMEKLDSFMREVMRFYPISLASFQRKVLKSFTLSNGQTIPAGVVIELPQGGVNFDEDIHDNASEFDALRFYKFRKAHDASEGPKTSEALANSQFVSVGSSSLLFGAGRRACPGRFFAVNEIKMIMANILLRYDIKNVDGEVERYKNMQFGAASIPNPKKTIMIRKV